MDSVNPIDDSVNPRDDSVNPRDDSRLKMKMEK